MIPVERIGNEHQTEFEIINVLFDSFDSLVETQNQVLKYIRRCWLGRCRSGWCDARLLSRR